MDPKTMQMLAMMGSLNGDTVGQLRGLDMAPRMQGMPRIDPTRMMDSMVVRHAIRQGMYGPGTQPRGGRIAQMMGGAAGFPQLGGGMDPSSVTDPSVANDALSPYGLQLPTHTNPFLFFNDQNRDGSPTWAGNHPKVAKAIEGAMIGATTPGGVTTGENISNVAKTVLGIPGLYKQSQAAQMQAPFDMAKQINALQMDSVNMQEKLATAYHLYATGQAALDKPPKPPHYQLYVDPKGKAFGYNQDTNAFETPAGTVPDSPEKPGTFGKQTGKYPATVKSQSERMGYDKYLADGGEVDDQGKPTNVNRYQAYVYSSQARSAGAQGAGGTHGRKQAGQGEGDVSQADDKALKSLEDDAKSKEAYAKEKIDLSQFSDAKDPVAARNAERANREAAAKAARDKYNQAAQGVAQQQPSSKVKGTVQPKGMVMHPDGRIEFPPPGQVK